MPVVPFIPMIASGIGALVSKKVGQKATAAAQERSPEEAAALSGATGAANTLSQTGSSLVSQGTGALGKAGSYYGTLLGGNRAAMAQATAAPRAQLQEGIRGAQTQLASSGIRGAARDQLSGNLMRQGASAVSGLTTGVQPMAAQGLGAVGSSLNATGAPMLGQSGNIFQNLLGQGFTNRKYARDEGEKSGTAMGNIIAGAGPILQKTFGGNSGGGGLYPTGGGGGYSDPSDEAGWG
jgi:hypothetical protein